MNLKQRFLAFPLFGAVLALVLAAGWLLPNHYKPWGTFHNNAWIAVTLAVAAFWQLARERSGIRLSRASLFLAGTALIPWFQHALGILPLPGDAFLNSLYLLGLAAVFAFGEHWARTRNGGPVGFVLSAACLASLVSVGMQIYQWFGLAEAPELLDVWIFPSKASRPYANLGQPNQLASLLLWGLLGAAWAWHQRWLRAGVATAVAAFILLGVALTESRTALLTLTMAATALSVRPPRFLDRRAVRTAQVLYVCYLAALFGLEPLARLWAADAPPLTMFERSAGEVRLAVWRALLGAANERPWLGIGWNATNAAYLQVYPQHPDLGTRLFEQSHNLPLDLVLWVGWPLALALLAGVAWWLWRIARSVADTPQLITVAALAVMLVHAMLELPLHHGYFLFPFGLLAGAAAAGLQSPPVATISRRTAWAASAALSALLAIVVHDYLRIESAFTELRFQLQRVGTGHDEAPPPTLLLNDWADYITMTRVQPTAGMSPAQIARWEGLLLYNAAPLAFRKVIGAHVLNGNPVRAQYWADRGCAVLEAPMCQRLLQEWNPQARAPAP